MKFIDYPELESLSRALTFESTECKVFTRLEAYSCKAVNKEKRLYKALENAYQQTASTSPPHYLDEILASPFGKLDQPNARKTLFLLIALLNGAFPDHDFSEINPSDFRKEPSPAVVLQSLSSTLASLRNGTEGPRSYSTFTGSFDAARQDGARSSSSVPSGREGHRQSAAAAGTSHAGLTSLLDEIMDIRDCDVFTFHPDVDSDPHACAEPEEEGPRFADDGYWSDDGDAQMQSVNYITPKKEIIDLDTPMFDEDFNGGFESQSVPASVQTQRSTTNQGPLTPQTPNLNDSPSQMGKVVPRRTFPREEYFYPGGSMSSASSMEAEDDDDVDGNGGLLWSTFAFFYNRRLKRILFVSVWSRRNNNLGSTQAWTSPSMQYEQVSSVPPSLSLPPQSTPSVPDVSKPAEPNTSDPPSQEQSKEGTPMPSPAKMTMARTTRLGTARGRRNGSGSPAPSSMSPFPHASPRPTTTGNSQVHPTGGATAAAAAAAAASRATGVKPASSTTSSRRQSTSRGSGAAGRPFNSLDGAALSISAPPARTSMHPHSHHPYSTSSSSKRPTAPPSLAPTAASRRRTEEKASSEAMDLTSSSPPTGATSDLSSSLGKRTRRSVAAS